LKKLRRFKLKLRLILWRYKFMSTFEAMKILSMEVRSSFGFFYAPLKSKQQQFNFKHEEVLYCELDIDEYLCVSN